MSGSKHEVALKQVLHVFCPLCDVINLIDEKGHKVKSPLLNKQLQLIDFYSPLLNKLPSIPYVMSISCVVF